MRTERNRGGLCKAKTKTGKPCRAFATAGGLCYYHANPEMARELGRIGGRKNRRLPNVTAEPSLQLSATTPAELRDSICRLIENVHSGKIDPRIATGLAPLLSLQLRVIEKLEFVPRLKALEEKILQIKKAKVNDEHPVKKSLDIQDDDEEI